MTRDKKVKVKIERWKEGLNIEVYEWDSILKRWEIVGGSWIPPRLLSIRSYILGELMYYENSSREEDRLIARGIKNELGI